METYVAKQDSRDVRPRWLTEFINGVAEYFEPISGVGRVGFDCQLAEECWVVGMYLGATEAVGGARDGSLRFTNFEFDMGRLIRCFSRVDEFYLGAFPQPQAGIHSTARSYVTISGLVAGNALRVQIFAIPPQDAGPGLQEFPNGECKAV